MSSPGQSQSHDGGGHEPPPSGSPATNSLDVCLIPLTGYTPQTPFQLPPTPKYPPPGSPGTLPVLPASGPKSGTPTPDGPTGPVAAASVSAESAMPPHFDSVQMHNVHGNNLTIVCEQNSHVTVNAFGPQKTLDDTSAEDEAFFIKSKSKGGSSEAGAVRIKDRGRVVDTRADDHEDADHEDDEEGHGGNSCSSGERGNKNGNEWGWGGNGGWKKGRYHK